MYPYVKTTQTLKAIAYTKVPTSIQIFMSQRRRWCLGANSNDLLLVYLPGINIFERIGSCVNVCSFMLQPFIFIATILFIRSVVTNPTMLMLYLAIIMIIPFFYGLIIPIFIKPLSFRGAFYYYLSLLFFISFGSIINLGIYMNSIANMDIIKWGKTRTIDKQSSMIEDIRRDMMEEITEDIDKYVSIENTVDEIDVDDYWDSYDIIV